MVRYKSLLGSATHHPNLDLVVIREQTEGEYSSLQHEAAEVPVEFYQLGVKCYSPDDSTLTNDLNNFCTPV